MSDRSFDITVADAQATTVTPIAAGDFDYSAYLDYENSMLNKCHEFWNAPSGVLVHRRMRVAEVFSYGCRDMKNSLEKQLGALIASILYKTDIPNFIEPWYGYCLLSTCFGLRYEWKHGQAPAVRAGFKSVRDVLNHDVVPVESTPEGKQSLEMFDYFIEATGGRIPICLSDIQSPLSIACSIVNISDLFMEMYDHPEQVQELLGKIANLSRKYIMKQLQKLEKRVVWPGHGFASSSCFGGLGVADDNALMLSSDDCARFTAKPIQQFNHDFGGTGYHSCGNWSKNIGAVKSIKNLKVVDAAFSIQTDPFPNPPEVFADAFANTGVVVNARIVGDAETIFQTVKRLWKPGMKLIVVTYCQSPQEQAFVYDGIHRICVQ